MTATIIPLHSTRWCNCAYCGKAYFLMRPTGVTCEDCREVVDQLQAVLDTIDAEYRDDDSSE